MGDAYITHRPFFFVKGEASIDFLIFRNWAQHRRPEVMGGRVVIFWLSCIRRHHRHGRRHRHGRHHRHWATSSAWATASALGGGIGMGDGIGTGRQHRHWAAASAPGAASTAWSHGRESGHLLTFWQLFLYWWRGWHLSNWFINKLRNYIIYFIYLFIWFYASKFNFMLLILNYITTYYNAPHIV